MITKTPEQAMANITDPRYIIQRFFWVIDKVSNDKIPFLFNYVQQKYYEARSQWDLILKARKEGFSTLILAIFLHACLFVQNTRAVVVSHEDDATKRIFSKVRFFLDTMGTKDIKFVTDLDKDSEKQISFPGTNSSFWIGTAGSRSFGRGDDITHLLLTEIAHYKNQDFIIGVLNACTKNAWRVLETTANGIGEMFHRLWEEAGDPGTNSQWKRHFFAWWQDASYRMPTPPQFQATQTEERMRDRIERELGVRIDNEQLYWYRRTYASSPSKDLFPQEYPGTPEEAFISSGRHVFPIEKLTVWLKKCAEPLWVGDLEDDGQAIQFVPNQEGNLRIWKKFREGRKYIIPADVAEGLKDGAFSVAPVIDRSSWEVVAEWRGHLDPTRFGQVLCTLGEFYNWSILVPELNNHGHTTIAEIRRLEYPHLLKTTDLWPKAAEKWGFPTDDRTKEQGISALRNAIEDESYFENSPVAIREMMRAVRDDHGKMVSQSGFTDCIITRMIGLYCLKFLTLDDTYRESQTSEAPMVVRSLVPKRRSRVSGRAA